MLGGACAAVFHQPAAPFAIVGMAAVFAGAAHVPIATMMMVTEMTGGYTLLVPATLAVVISYLVQTRLSTRLSYRSVYEAQVANRGESPAHHEKHLEIALRILREKGMRGNADAGSGDGSDAGSEELVSLLRSGAAVELPGERRLAVGVLRADSPFVGKTVGESAVQLEAEGMTVVSVIRGEHMLAPRPDLTFTKGDRLILVAKAGELEHAWKHMKRW
jgi:CIC family chloride channel protein